MTSTPSMVLFDSAAKLQPSNRVSIRSPPHLPAKVTLAIREAACKAFKVARLFVVRLSAFQMLEQAPGLLSNAQRRKSREQNGFLKSLFLMHTGTCLLGQHF